MEMLGFDMEHLSAAQKMLTGLGCRPLRCPVLESMSTFARPLSPSRDRELSICGPFVNLVAYSLHRSVAPASGTALPSRLVA